MGQHSQYSDYEIWWKIWGSNLGSSKRIISSPKHPYELHHPHSIRLNENQTSFSGSKATRADISNTQILVEASTKIIAAIPLLNLSPSMAHIGTTLFYLHPYLCTYLSRCHIFPAFIKEHFYTFLTCYLQPTRTNYFICIDPITLTLRTVPIKNVFI